jgi:hypothetical protein
MMLDFLPKGGFIGYWLLVIGYWLLVTGYWLLVIGYWLLVTSIVLHRAAPEARREVSPARQRWESCFRMTSAGGATHCLTPIFRT